MTARRIGIRETTTPAAAPGPLRRAMFAAAVLLAGGAAGPLPAAQFIVDRIDDSATLTNCNPAVPSDCTLRGAVIAANANPGLDQIRFNLTGPLGRISALTILRSATEGPEDGDIDITDDLVIDGELTLGGVSIVGVTGFDDSIFDVDQDIEVTMLDLRIGGGNAADCGGGVRNFGHLVLVRVDLHDNAAPTSGGGLCSRSGFLAATLPSVVLSQSSVIGNTAGASGGGIAVGKGTLEIRETTVSGNTAGSGAAVTVFGNQSGPVLLRHATMVGNTHLDPNGFDLSLDNNFASVVQLRGSIVQGNCRDVSSQISSLGGNLEGPGNTCHLIPAVDQIGVADLRLGPLAPSPLVVTRGHRPRWNSPAVDDPTGVLTTCPSPDQFLQPRPTDGDGDGIARCDAGALESRPAIFIDGFESGSTIAWSMTVP